MLDINISFIFRNVCKGNIFSFRKINGINKVKQITFFKTGIIACSVPNKTSVKLPFKIKILHSFRKILNKNFKIKSHFFFFFLDKSELF